MSAHVKIQQHHSESLTTQVPGSHCNFSKGKASEFRHHCFYLKAPFIKAVIKQILKLGTIQVAMATNLGAQAPWAAPSQQAYLSSGPDMIPPPACSRYQREPESGNPGCWSGKARTGCTGSQDQKLLTQMTLLLQFMLALLLWGVSSN